MTMTPQDQTLQAIDPSDEERRPGTLDVAWAERAFQLPLPERPRYAVRHVAPPRCLSAFGRGLVAAGLTACLVITAATAAAAGLGPRQPSPARHHAPAVLQDRPTAQPRGSGPSLLLRCPVDSSTRTASAADSHTLFALPSCSDVTGPALYR